MVPALVAAPDGGVRLVVSTEVRKLYSVLSTSLCRREHVCESICVFVQHSHHHHALGSRKAVPVLIGTPVAGLLFVHVFTSAMQEIA